MLIDTSVTHSLDAWCLIAMFYIVYISALKMTNCSSLKFPQWEGYRSPYYSGLLHMRYTNHTTYYGMQHCRLLWYVTVLSFGMKRTGTGRSVFPILILADRFARTRTLTWQWVFAYFSRPHVHL